MAKVRQDAWSHEDDLLLAETVLRHIREGSTQLNAFEEVGDELNRTSAACGFRWNAEVRNKYISAIDLAKRQRKDRKRQQSTHLRQHLHHQPAVANVGASEIRQENTLIMEPEDEEDEPQTLSMEMVIHYLQSFQKDMFDSSRLKGRSDKLQIENNELINKISSLEKELSLNEKKLATVEDDYKTFIQIMERARKMTVLEDQTAGASPKFKMDKNGNLEQVVQSNTN